VRKLLVLAWKQWRRDSRTGELRVLAAALVLAVASVGTVGLFADRVKTALTSQANVLLGADLLITADRPLPPVYAEEAKRRGLAVVESIRFNSMVATDATPVLADVKAVAPGYPLRGQILIEDPSLPEGRPTRDLPRPGGLWIDQRLRARLGTKVGDKVQVGDSSLRVEAVIQQEPEMSGGFLALSPKVLMTMADLPATNLLQPGNRAAYRLLLAGAATDPYRAWLLPKLAAGQRVENIRDLRPEVKSTLERAEKFLGLSALVAVLLAAVAVALAARRYLHRQLDAAGIMRCLGASQGQVLALYVLQFLWLGVAASVVGCLVAFAGQQVLAGLLQSLFKAELPWPGTAPALSAFVVGIVLLFGFALPPLIALSNVPPLRVLRRDLGAPGASGVLAYVLGVGVIAALIFWQAGDTKTGAIMLGGVAALLAAALVVAWLLLKAVQRIPQRGYSWRYGLANLRRRPLASCLQIGALGLGLMALLLLSVVRVDLLKTWQSSLPPDAPNKFLINVQPDQTDSLGTFLAKRGVRESEFSPMIRGRLVALNGKPIGPADYPQERAKRLIEREFNLSWATSLPPGNRIVGGKWWDAKTVADTKSGEAKPAGSYFSLEDGIAETLKIKIGDQLTYDIAGQRVSAEVNNLRKVDWDSFRVNFFALATPGLLDQMPQSYITAFRLPDGREATITELVRTFPNVLLIDVTEIMRQVQAIMGQVSRAVEFVFLFTLIAGILVLQAAIASTQDERRFDTAILRTLGAQTRQVRSAQLMEFLVLGLLAGVLAAAGASAVGWAVAEKVLQIPYRFDPTVLILGIGAGVAAVMAAGWWGTRVSVRQPPLVTLRQVG
jgi:putative ABC transport system permease protein